MVHSRVAEKHDRSGFGPNQSEIKRRGKYFSQDVAKKMFTSVLTRSSLRRERTLNGDNTPICCQFTIFRHELLIFWSPQRNLENDT